MAMRHRTLPIEGVQFHPESVLTQGGHLMLANWLAACGYPRRSTGRPQLAAEVETRRRAALRRLTPAPPGPRRVAAVSRRCVAPPSGRGGAAQPHHAVPGRGSRWCRTARWSGCFARPVDARS